MTGLFFAGVVFDAVVVLGDVALAGAVLAGVLVFGAAALAAVPAGAPDCAGALVEVCGVSVVVVLGLCARKGTMA